MAGRPAALTSEQIEIIRDARRKGTPAAEIARDTGTPLRSVQRALAGVSASSPAGPAAEADADADAAPSLLAALGAESAITGRDPLDIAKAAIERTDVIAQREAAAGNVAGYAALLKRQTDLITAVRQLEAQRSRENAAEGGAYFSREELRAGEAIVYERLKALEADRIANGGLCCVKCSEQIRLADAEAHATEAGR